MSDPKIRIEIAPDGLAYKKLAMSEFVHIVNKGRDLLRQIVVSALGKDHKYDFYLVDLSHNSLARLDIAFPSSGPHKGQGQRVYETLKKQCALLQSGSYEEIDEDIARSFGDMLAAPAKKGVRVEIQSVAGHKTTAMATNGRSTIATLHNLCSPLATRPACAIGKLDWLNIHHDNKKLKIFPRVAEWKPIEVHFGPDFQGEVIASVGKIVEISGQGRYRRGAFWPHSIQMESIKTLPDESTATNLMELHGKFPRIAGNRGVVEYLRDMRSKDE